MPDGADLHTVKSLPSIHEIASEDWNACAGPDDPFVGHAFLAALEDSGSVGIRAGWIPRHLGAYDAAGRLIACAPAYLKTHSYGEYVFDWSWADAYQRSGGRYYPKLQVAIPFTPIAGNRLLVREGASADTAEVLAGALIRLAQRLDISSVHVTFPIEAQWEQLGRLGFLLRIGHQFHWHNHGYRDFDDFLAELSSRKRKAIRKERKSVADQGITVRTLVGGDIEDRHWDAFYRFYRNTHDRKWGHAYLNRAFFRLLGGRLRDRAVMVIAETTGAKIVAGALNLRGPDALYGRYWGCLEDYRFLHFEACYYRAIDFAISNRLERVEAGAQGPHKIQRGYLPFRTYSAHWIADAGFRDALARYLAAERLAVEEEMAQLSSASPFRQDSAIA
jgi:predicted N-acyltransferase